MCGHIQQEHLLMHGMRMQIFKQYTRTVETLHTDPDDYDSNDNTSEKLCLFLLLHMIRKNISQQNHEGGKIRQFQCLKHNQIQTPAPIASTYIWPIGSGSPIRLENRPVWKSFGGTIPNRSKRIGHEALQ